MNFKSLLLFLILFNYAFISPMKKGCSNPSSEAKGLSLLSELATKSPAAPVGPSAPLDIFDTAGHSENLELARAVDLSLREDQDDPELVAAIRASLDKNAEIEAFRARALENENLRKNPANRLLKRIFNSPRIFHVRSLCQVNDWMCGHYVLFNSRFIQFILFGEDFNIKEPFESNLQRSFGPEFYRSDSFFEFYREVSINAYQKEPEELKRDPFSGELCIDPDFTGRNLLDSDHFSWVTSMLQSPHFYVLRNFTTGIDIVPGIDQMELGRSIESQGGSQRYLINLRNQLNGKYALNFACFAGGNHWILVSVVNFFNEFYSPVIIIMDSFNNNLSDHPEMVAYISYLEDIFLKQEAGMRPVVECPAFKVTPLQAPTSLGVMSKVFGLFGF